ncbi:type I restriction enzyme HsdR N-terminal domain-containing protein [Cellulophaga baltica]|uniref:type I restriction enzyme HsdR N-terminal domain-containing protein n=1 Tax=Cellulophaga baltica TaxID=76594 RepID=UPI002148CA46|nr:type I restriction enzyme HsdR N-terminal domain-containing protein [Cellulophaga baltica]MCR1026642.1 type I restriction enzyme HsdR N-terminal domain-containing protein [Cellulophaga baltica]
MTEIEHLEEIKRNYTDNSLNESDTRLKIIDTILVDVLKWPKSTITTEKYINGNRADYVLKNELGTPILIIESKRESVFFELPQTANSDKNFEKISVEKLLTDDNIKSAMFQVKEYAEDLVCNYACICNGKSWIIFKISSNTKPWKKLPAFVIKNIDFFLNDLTKSTNLLGYHSVIKDSSLTLNIGVTKKTYKEIFYPKNNITTYDTPVNNNHYAGSLKTLSREFLGPIPEKDSAFMKACYVHNKGKNDSLQKDVQGFLHDSITPYFKNLGFRDFTDNKEGGAFGTRISNIVKNENINKVMILFGGRGAGKSTFIKRFLFHEQPIEIAMHSKVALVPLLFSSQTKEELANEIWQNTFESIDTENFRFESKEKLLEIFEEEFEIFKRQILSDYEVESSEYKKLTTEFISDKLKNIKLFSEKIASHWMNKKKKLVVFIDNMDQLPNELQDTCFLTASEISEKLDCLVIVSMREERYFDANSRGVLDAYQNSGFHLSSPVIPEVIIKRIDYILENLKFTVDIESEFGIKNTTDLNTIVSFLEICRKELCRKTSPLSYFLRIATHGDVRKSLEFFKGFLTSGYTNINEMAPHSNWKFQVHQVIKPMMIPERIFYNESNSKIPNIYQLRNDTLSSHFTGLRILHYLHNKNGDKGSKGFIDIKFLIHQFDIKYDSKLDCIKHLSLYLEKGLIESNNRLETFTENVDQIKLTAFGNYIYDYLAFNFAYLDLISLDCGLFNESLNNSMVESANSELQLYYSHNYMARIKKRIDRTREFIEYLEGNENQEFEDLNLGDSEMRFIPKLKEQIEIQIDGILKSAYNKKSIEDSLK